MSATVTLLTDERIKEIIREALKDAQAVPNEVWDVPRLADYLGVKPGVVYTLVANNEIPHRRVGKLIRFHPAAISEWLKNHGE